MKDEKKNAQLQALHEVTHYNPVTGEIHYTKTVGAKAKEGGLVGKVRKGVGTFVIKFQGRSIPAWKLIAYKMDKDKYEEFLGRSGCCLFKDGDKTNLAFDNLSIVCRSKMNSLARQRSDAKTTGVRGVWFKKTSGLFVAYYRNDYLGSFDSYKEALAARESAVENDKD